MNTKIKKTALYLTAVVSGALVLSACSSHSNPLLKEKKQQAALFLYKAQSSASLKTGLYDSAGSAYVACVQYKNHFGTLTDPNSSKGCHKFFLAMLDYAKTTSRYKDITISDLDNKQVVKRLSDEISTIDANGGKL